MDLGSLVPLLVGIGFLVLMLRMHAGGHAGHAGGHAGQATGQAGSGTGGPPRGHEHGAAAVNGPGESHAGHEAPTPATQETDEDRRHGC